MTDTDRQISAARHLFAGALRGVLSTRSQELEDYPFGSVVPYCLDYRGTPVLLLSHLSQHTRNLEADPKVALTVIEKGEGDIQRLGRLTCVAEALPFESEIAAVQTRYFRYFPSAQPYFEQLNFRFYRMQPVRFYFVGGFGRARWFGTDRILQANPLSPADETSLIEQSHPEYSEALKKLVQDATGKVSDEAVFVTGIDRHGMDLRQDDRSTRIPLIHPISDYSQAQAALRDMLQKDPTKLDQGGGTSDI